MSLTADAERSADEVRAFADRAAHLYGLPSIHVLVSANRRSPAGLYRRGYFAVSERTLSSSFRDAIVAHELAHYVLGHDAPLRGVSDAELKREYQERELEANAKSVEILSRAAGMSEERALRTVYDYLLGAHRAVERAPRLDLSGHKPPCEEIADLLARFPEQRAWTATLECAPASLRAGG